MIKFAIAFYKERHTAEVKEIKDNYDKAYTSASSLALSEEPFRFGRKRIGKHLELVFEQLQAIKEGVLDIQTLVEAANKLGITYDYTKDGHLEINVDYEPKNAKKTAKTIVI